jgi:hypothetical protein
MSTSPVQMYRAVTVYGGNIAKSTFYKWVREGRVKLYRVGGASYVDEDFAAMVRRISAEDAVTATARGRAGSEAAQRKRRAKEMMSRAADNPVPAPPDMLAPARSKPSRQART